ncbi:HAMP domain-containing protein [Chlamydiifrater phoenicopteri]|uniref:HAMP domain-containing protein n=1 Tax=Chlamydiifrater phoenicopteri TaxID=2681469 RepID=UPI001BCE5F6E|nr:regulator of sigma subunit [Chlamydiifrater phoenicopteri]
MPKQTFTTRILLFLFIIIPIPLFLNLGIFTFFSFSEALDSTEQCFRAHATNLSLEIKKVLSFKKLFLERVANTISLKELTVPTQDQTFFPIVSSELSEVSDSFDLCLLDSKTGKVWAKNSNDPFVFNLSQKNSLRSKLFRYSGMTFITKVSDPQTQEKIPYIAIVEEIDTPKNGFTTSSLSGFLIAFQKLKTLQKELFQNITLSHGDILLVNHRGEILLSSSEFLPKELLLDSSTYTFESLVPDGPKITSKTPSSAIPIYTPKLMRHSNLVSAKIEGKYYLGFLLDKLPIENTYTLSLLPLSHFLLTTFRLPLIILFFYIITFSLMAFVLTRLNRKVSKPLQELTTCMEAAWKGNYNVRFEPDRYGYEVNDLGNVFNCTLLRLLISMEKADKERQANQSLRNELALLQTLKTTLLEPHYPFGSNIQKFTNKTSQLSQRGYFEGWVERKNSKTETHLIGALGYSTDKGLPSYLYALSAKSLFLAQADTTPKLEDIGSKVFSNLQDNLSPHHSVNFLIIDFCFKENSVTLSFFGETQPKVFVRKKASCEEVSLPSKHFLSPGDSLIVLNANENISLDISEEINPFLSDSLHPIQGESLMELFEDAASIRNLAEKKISIYQMSEHSI